MFQALRLVLHWMPPVVLASNRSYSPSPAWGVRTEVVLQARAQRIDGVARSGIRSRCSTAAASLIPSRMPLSRRHQLSHPSMEPARITRSSRGSRCPCHDVASSSRQIASRASGPAPAFTPLLQGRGTGHGSRLLSQHIKIVFQIEESDELARSNVRAAQGHLVVVHDSMVNGPTIAVTRSPGKRGRVPVGLSTLTRLCCPPEADTQLVNSGNPSSASGDKCSRSSSLA